MTKNHFLFSQTNEIFFGGPILFNTQWIVNSESFTMQDEPEQNQFKKQVIGDSDQESHTERHDSNHERHTN